jgi:hypothetical protein
VSVTLQNDAPSIVPSLEAVGRLLREGVLEVPPYQRSYAWIDEQVDTYWFDLRAALIANEPIYFLGTVVISSGAGERSVVIDGQQRLATTSLLFAAIRDAFAERGDATRARTVQERFLSWASLESTDVEPRLILNEQDRDYFSSIVGERPTLPPPDEGDPDSVTGLYKAFASLSDKLDDDIEAAGPYWQDRLLTWIGFLDRIVRVIVVRVRDDADAFLIFETLNARGLELSAADLIKNYLFGLCRHRLPEAQEAWASMARAIEASAGSAEITTFLRHWWASRYGAVREKALYRNLKRSVQSQDQALEVLQGLTGAAPYYAAMLNSEDDFWIRRPDTSRASVTVLLELGLEQYRPLLLAGLERLQDAEADRLLHALASWSVRGLIAGGIGGGTTERYYAEAAVRISNGRVSTAAEVLVDLDPVLASDEDFESTFATRRVSRTRLIHYYLRAISERRAVPNRSETDTAVVPVFPRSDPGGAWSQYIDSEVLTRTSMRIGNFMLIPRQNAVGLPRDPEERIAVLSSLDRLRAELHTIGRRRRSRKGSVISLNSLLRPGLGSRCDTRRADRPAGGP